MTPDIIALGAIWFVVFLFSTTLHEAGHALAAYRLGDPTAYHGGQVSLSPLPHLRREPVGMAIVPLVSFALTQGGWMFGWASAPFDPAWALRHPRRAGVMALAGPLANLVLVLLSGIAIRVGVSGGVFYPPPEVGFADLTAAVGGGAMAGVATTLSVLFSLNLILFVFNLMPFPPLDGSAVVQLALPEDAARRYQEFLHQPMLALAGILVAWKLFGYVFRPVLGIALQVLYPEVPYA